MIISLALICGVAFGEISGVWLLMLMITWVPDVAIIAIISDTIRN